MVFHETALQYNEISTSVKDSVKDIRKSTPRAA